MIYKIMETSEDVYVRATKSLILSSSEFIHSIIFYHHQYPCKVDLCHSNIGLIGNMSDIIIFQIR